MKTLSVILAVWVILAPVKSLSKGKINNNRDSELSTNVEFDPMTVHGRYQSSNKGTAKVEDEKVLYDLLGPRKNFKDRIKQMARQK